MFYRGVTRGKLREGGKISWISGQLFRKPNKTFSSETNKTRPTPREA